jgi:hypothetical protein
MKKRLLPVLAVLIFIAGSSLPAMAKPSEYDLIVRHLKSKYQAKKVTIPFIWLARFAVSVARPAGVKSFSVTLFNGLKFSRTELDKEMQAAMRSSFGQGWESVFHVRSQTGQQAYMYMQGDNKNVRIALVTIDKEQAAVIRATFNPDKLVDFINDPKIFGISLDDKDQKKNNSQQTQQNENPQPQPAAPEGEKKDS